MTPETPFEKLVDKLYIEWRLPPKVASDMVDEIEALATERTKALAKIKKRTYRDYCRASHTFDKYWHEAWTAARDEVLNAHERTNDEDDN